MKKIRRDIHRLWGRVKMKVIDSERDSEWERERGREIDRERIKEEWRKKEVAMQGQTIFYREIIQSLLVWVYLLRTQHCYQLTHSSYHPDPDNREYKENR